MTSGLPALPATELTEIVSSLRDAKAPRPLSRVIQAAKVMTGSDQEISTAQLLSWLESAGPNDPQRVTIATAIACWDAMKDASWIDGTPPNTQSRRALILSCMDLSEEEGDIVNRTFPQSPSIEPPITITQPEGWARWYVPQRRTPSFYWDSYRCYLVDRKQWEPKNIAALDVASTEVVERLCDPMAAKLRPTKGLVIGYVQSGKTANFTGVIAKAVDAGYRLVIVLAGMQNILRGQTQRRIDKELLGKEFVAGDYEGEKDWPDFVSHNCQPSHAGAFDWIRLTTANQDFRDVAKGLVNFGLMFESVDKTKPFRSQANLGRSHARLAVVKKNPKALRDFITSLVGAAKHIPLQEIPTLIIDDESDQASINAQSRRASESKRRKTINGLLVELLGTLRNAQYVGYTATPFANVFIDPEDTVDLFPSDFILSLPKPMHYMGVREFTDDSLEADDDRSNRWAHVREIRGRDEDEGNLDVAVDAYVLSGAIKVFRETSLGKRFRHHTMLVHSSPLQAEHNADAAKVRGLFLSANYLGVSGMSRLRRLWDSDFAERCQKRAGDAPVPATWQEVEACVPIAHGRITDTGDPVIVLNGEDTEAAPDFDSQSIWKIIVGGAKLSRGYTVEGLTISYYRRTAKAADTLLQMGRWFGFRPHYRDLVRLYIGVEEAIGKKGEKQNLYDAFEAACRDEEEFRGQLSRYASLDPDQRITPKQTPPLVPAHLLPPTSRTKMFNAVQTFVNFGGETVERTATATDGPRPRQNVKLLSDLLRGTKPESCNIALSVDGVASSFEAVTATQSNRQVAVFLERFNWEGGVPPRDWTLVTEFVNGKHGDPEIDSWLVMAPQRKSDPYGAIEIEGQRLRIKQRGRTGNRFLVFTEPEHVRVAKWIAGVASGNAGNATTEKLAAPKRAVMLVYPVIPTKDPPPDAVPSIGIALYFPKNKIRRQVLFSVRDASRPDDIVVPAAG
jgi:hypothetical protein